MKASTLCCVAFTACAFGWTVGCESDERSLPVAEIDHLVRSLRLVDPQTWYSESDFFSADSGTHFRVEVVTTTGVDTVPEVLVLQLPVVLPDSLHLSGVALDANDIARGVFTYSPGSRSLEMNASPGPGYLPYSEPAFSPSGDHLAYLANDRNYHFWLVVLSWPDRDVVIETPQVQTMCTEFWGNALRWVSADSVELYMNLCKDESWVRAAGSPEVGSYSVDTVGIEVLEALRPSQ